MSRLSPMHTCVMRGEIKRLIITVPPRGEKHLCLCSVARFCARPRPHQTHHLRQLRGRACTQTCQRLSRCDAIAPLPAPISRHADQRSQGHRARGHDDGAGLSLRPPLEER
jgi:hypothetical protein